MFSGSSSEGDTASETEPKVATIPPIVAQIRKDMRDSWRRDDKLLEKFFPVKTTSDLEFQNGRKKLYHDSKRYGKRWKRIPGNPKSPSSLHKPLTNLMNNILSLYGIRREKRLFLDTHVRRAATSKPPSPSIFFAGVGPEFASTAAELPRAIYPSGIAAFEVSLDSESSSQARDRLAVHMHWIFQHQANRRFAYGLVITESMFTVYMFDHSGAVASKPCNYHADPDQFCAVIFELASGKDRNGFDKSIFGEGPYTKIRTLEPNEDKGLTEIYYIIEERLFQFSSLVGRGTICWLTWPPDDLESSFVVKDAWIAPAELAGRESEGSLLRHAKSRGVVRGVVQIRHSEEVRRSTNVSDLDTVFHNRQVGTATPAERKLDRIHTRIVMETYGKTLDKFGSRREFLLAFHDAVVAHRRLHDVAGILHRDISVRNILINPEGVEGDRGILIDFDHAIRVKDESPYSTKTKIGTWRYMSRNVLDEEGPHTYLDDLESFYYVLCWILVAFEGPGMAKADLPEDMDLWDYPGSAFLKRGHFVSKFTLPVDPWFGACFSDLAGRLYRFFRTRRKDLGKPLSALDPTKDYNDFLSHVRQCIADMEAEKPISPAHDVETSSLTADPATHKRPPSSSKDQGFPALPSSARKRPRPASHTGRILQISRKRPRREGVNYGESG